MPAPNPTSRECLRSWLTSRDTLQVFRQETRAFQYLNIAERPAILIVSGDGLSPPAQYAGRCLDKPLDRYTLRVILPPNRVVFGEIGPFRLRYRQSHSKQGFEVECGTHKNSLFRRRVFIVDQHRARRHDSSRNFPISGTEALSLNVLKRDIIGETRKLAELRATT